MSISPSPPEGAGPHDSPHTGPNAGPNAGPPSGSYSGPSYTGPQISPGAGTGPVNEPLEGRIFTGSAGPRPPHPPRRPRQRSTLGFLAVMALLLVVLPLGELALIIALARQIGAPSTIVLLLLLSLIGTWLVRREGAATWRALASALGAGRLPSRELADAALVLTGGVLLMTPGFITDAIGFFLLLPFTRPLGRRWIQVIVERRLLQQVGIVRGGVR